MTMIKDEEQLGLFVDHFVEQLLANVGRKPIVIAMEGPLGAGKTAMTKMIARKVGVQQQLTSPTYVLIAEYPIPGYESLLQHLDVYRLESEDEFKRLQIERMLKHNDVLVIEWADKFEEDIKSLRHEDIKLVWVKIGYGEEENERKIEVLEKS